MASLPGNILDRAAATLKEGFLTTWFGNRGAVAAFIILSSAFPFSSSSLLWVGLAMAVQGAVTHNAYGLTFAHFYELAGTISLLGVAGMAITLWEMVRRPKVRELTT